ncbi:IMP dehydrogenase [Candidatus Woesearchaeota archaeon]|mgnify:CR=1 FL=1|jgi:IMP dehydrogenase|nr:IMP dehydrogenase [Candidatus Woesearchaeota archaeon]MBT6518350.1 IMP dehydrogenase [Candidatus Woesearchaeota archaeon]MBT7366647.1 IMP dehydrogenase [Candidatus Woesearchaeota archaeon]
MVEIKLKLSYDDVLLSPNKAIVNSRSQISTKTKLTKNIALHIPVVSANMDSVTEAEMAIAMARRGGIGIIHRFLSVEDEAEEVRQVKRADNFVIEEPYTISVEKKLGDVKELMQLRGVNGLVVVEGEKLRGIITNRDVIFQIDLDVPVAELMTPFERLHTGGPDLTIGQAKEIFKTTKIEKIPLVDSEGNLRGLVCQKDISKIEKYPYASRDKKGRLLVGAAIGTKPDFMIRAKALLDAGVDVLVIDVAHGHSTRVIEVLQEIKRTFKHVEVIAGNVATAEGTRELIEAGADGIKVGVGPGSICTTRIVSGSGVPQLSAVMDCAKVAHEYEIPLIADGGIKVSGDVTKALAAGASTVMLGNLLAGTDESPGLLVLRNGDKYKIIRGMASFGAAMGRKYRLNGNSKTDDKELEDVVPEGVEAMVRYKGSVGDVLSQLVGGLRSGISYCGADSINGMWANANFVQITNSGLRESKSHDVNLV